MNTTRKFLQILSVFFAGLFVLGAAAHAQVTDEVISEINGVKITRSDLEKAQGNKLLQARYQYYLAEQKALDEYIDTRLIEMEAAKEKLTVDQLLDKEVNGKIVDPTEEQLQVYYDDYNGKEPYEAVRDKIKDYIHQRRQAKYRAAFIQKLRTQGSVLITLAPPGADFPLTGAPRLGPEDAPVRLVEFADYECPYCAKVNPHLAKLREEFGDKVSVYYKDLPLPMHARARKAAEAARCAGDQGKFWEYHDVLFSGGLEVSQLKHHAEELKLDSAKFDQCLDTGAESATVQRDFSDAQQLGLSGTPAFFINGHYFSGAVEYKTLRDMVAQQLASSSAKQTASR